MFLLCFSFLSKGMLSDGDSKVKKEDGILDEQSRIIEQKRLVMRSYYVKFTVV